MVGLTLAAPFELRINSHKPNLGRSSGSRNHAKSMCRTINSLVSITVVALGLSSCAILDDGIQNRSVLQCSETQDPAQAYGIEAKAMQRHQELMVADMHGDPLLWDRDGISNWNRRGHIDVVRLLKGNVGIQMLNIVSKVPLDITSPYHSGLDMTGLLAMAQGWPMRTWWSRPERANFQTQRWRQLAGADERVVGITSREAMEEFLASQFHQLSGKHFSRRKDVDARVGILLGIEGVHAFGNLDEDSTQIAVHAELNRWIDRGVTLFGITHLFDNQFGGSSEGTHAGGLTPLGEKLVRAMIRSGVIIDLAHASPAVIDDLISLTEHEELPVPRVVFSHGGVREHTPGMRNVSADHAAWIARQGGLICIGYWDRAVGGVELSDISGAMARTAELLEERGIQRPWDHIAIGSDFDGFVNTLFNADGHGLLTQELITVENRLGETELVERVMGGNTVRFLRTALPSRRTARR